MAMRRGVCWRQEGCRSARDRPAQSPLAAAQRFPKVRRPLSYNRRRK